MQRKRVLTREVRIVNRNLVFRSLYEQGRLTKSDLRSLLHLSLPTIDQNLAELSSRGLIRAVESPRDTGGRKAMDYLVQCDARYAVGVDITANHVATVILNLCGDILYRQRARKVFEPTRAYCADIARHIARLLREHDIPSERVLGVGLAVPAIVSGDARQLTYASLLHFTDGRLSDFEACMPYPCRFVNDATAGGFAEAWFNPTIRHSPADQTIAYLSLSNSVGGAFLSKGSIYEGENQRASEFGHMCLHPQGLRCYCGQAGCVDSYLTAKRLSDPCDGNLAAFFEGLEQGDATLLHIFDAYVEDLVLVINNLRMVYDCPIICGGYVGTYLTPHLPGIRQKLAGRNTFEVDGDYLLECAYRFEAAAVGAALHYLDSFIQSI